MTEVIELKYITCGKGDPCNFQVEIETGLSADYTLARFQVRAGWDDTLPVLLSASETDGITFDYENNLVNVTLGGTRTRDLPVINQAKEVAAQLRLYNAADLDDCASYKVPMVLTPEAIDDEPEVTP